MPSEPHNRRETSKPATFFITWPPKRSRSPLPVSRRVPSTKSRAAPAYMRRGPERPAAITPPSVVAGPEGGRLEGQELITLGERALELGQRRAAARRHHEL